ncbi:hypothetical protein JOC73_001514 [Alkaliphilus hydrothermalis]|uniref:Uncharacterized protein n=1 Tax=Alkaliphilus hydrothermalis TaxID=1482730 RepID=A0ABS2NPX3_9FIRM|nr:hypothetical protein [Alkaliphilus hydrothermalis]
MIVFIVIGMRVSRYNFNFSIIFGNGFFEELIDASLIIISMKCIVWAYKRLLT